MMRWEGLATITARLTRIEQAFRSPGALKRDLGRRLVAQTRERILREKTSPEGVAWRPWSPEYARTRGAGHSLLIDSRDLLNSIRSSVTKDGASVHSDVPYAGVQQGARPFLGISDKNAEEITDFVNDWLARI